MTYIIEQNFPGMDEGVTFENPVTMDSTLTVDGQFGAKELSGTVTSDTTLTIEESGKTIYMGTAGVDITLPPVSTAAGVVYRFVCSANFSTTSMTIKTDSLENKIYGSLEVAGAVVLCSAEDTITFVNSAELPGDWIELRSDGTNWYLTGQAGTSGGLTCTAT